MPLLFAGCAAPLSLAQANRHNDRLPDSHSLQTFRSTIDPEGQKSFLYSTKNALDIKRIFH